MTTVSDQLRHALLKAPASRYRIWKETGIRQGHLSAFVHRKRGLSQETSDILCQYLGLELRPIKKRKE